MKKIAILGGGTVFHVRPHLALSAPAYGSTARSIKEYVSRYNMPNLDWNIELHLTKMATGLSYSPETNEDISNLVDKLIADPEIKIIFFTVAMCDFEGYVNDFKGQKYVGEGKDAPRLKTGNLDSYFRR